MWRRVTERGAVRLSSAVLDAGLDAVLDACLLSEVLILTGKAPDDWWWAGYSQRRCR